MKCRLCGKDTIPVFEGRILRRFPVRYFRCPECSMLQTQKPTWLKQAYKNSINLQDTGIMQRNISFARWTAVILLVFFRGRGSFLDFAGGYGIFTRLMRDHGLDFRWTDEYSQNLLARGFEDDGREHWTALTAFEVFEHFADPAAELKKIFSRSGFIIVSTEMIPASGIENWWYLGPHHGQHICFYDEKTMSHIAATHGRHYRRIGPLHVFSSSRLSRFRLVLVKLLVRFPLKWKRLFVRGRTVSDMHLLEKQSNQPR